MRALFILPLLVITLAAFGGWERPPGQFTVGAPPSYTGECTSSADLDALPASHWCEVPSSELNDLAPSPAPYGYSFTSVMSAWSGAVWDDANNQLLVMGGGHDDGPWDGVWGFSLSDFAWHTRRANSVEAEIPKPNPAEVVEEFPNGSWSSRHTYYGLAWDTTRDVMYVLGGSMWNLGFAGDRIWDLNPSDGSINHIETLPAGEILSAVYIQEFDSIFFANNDENLQRYNVATDTYSTLPSAYLADRQYYMPLTWDPVEEKIVSMGWGLAREIVFNVGATDATVTNIAPTGCSAVIATQAPGAAYDSSTGKIYYYLNQGETRVFSYDTATRVCTELPAAGGNLVTPTPNDVSGSCPSGCGTFGRWQAVSSHPGVFIFVGSTTGNVAFWRAP